MSNSEQGRLLFLTWPRSARIFLRNQLVTVTCESIIGVDGGRIIAVNGHRAAGTWAQTQPAGVILSMPVIWAFDLSGPDHAHAGTIAAMQSTAGTRAASDFAIVSGTGAYAGVTGTVRQENVTKLERTARGEVIAQTFCAHLTPVVYPRLPPFRRAQS